MTFLSIAEKYFCDPRTVKSCILHNKPSSALGEHTCPRKIAPYYEEISQFLISTKFDSAQSISRITHTLYEKIKDEGYTGCERTVRNYITAVLSNKKVLRKKENNDVKTNTN